MKGSSLLGRLTTQGVTDPEGIWGVDKTAPARLLESEDGGGALIPKMRITHAFAAKTHKRRVELIPFWIKRRDALPQSSHWLHGRPAQTRQRATARTGSAAACTPGATARRRRIARPAG